MGTNKEQKSYNFKIEDIIKGLHSVTLEDLEEAEKLSKRLSDCRDYFDKTYEELLVMLDTSFKNISKTLPYKPESRARWAPLRLIPKIGKNIPKKSLTVFYKINSCVNKVLASKQKCLISYNCITGEEELLGWQILIYDKPIVGDTEKKQHRIVATWNEDLILFTLIDAKNILNALRRLEKIESDILEDVNTSMAIIKDTLIAYQ